MNDILTSTTSMLDERDDPIDLLGRQGIINKIKCLLNSISKSNGCCTFALNGKWGSGKTFALNKLQRQLERDHGDEYLIFHYNCWQYDYYDEPLVAIVAAILSSIEKETYQFSSDTRNKAKITLVLAVTVLKSIFKGMVKNKLGIDDEILKNLEELEKEGTEAAKEAMEHIEESRDFDAYDSFKKAMDETRKALADLAKNRTIVVVVDELDRCLPDYAIKVLERLHHLFDGLSNSVVILAVDKAQLENSVKQIFGSTTKTDAYLKKFIKFELVLDTGKIEGPFREKYTSYFSLFDESYYITDFDFDYYLAALFDGIDIRSQERLIERIETAHRMVIPNGKRDYIFMCFELMWLVFTEYHAKLNSENNQNNRQIDGKMPITYESDRFCIAYSTMKRFEEYMRETWGAVSVGLERGENSDRMMLSLNCTTSVQHYLVWYLQEMCSSESEYRWWHTDDLPHLSEFEAIADVLRIFQ